MKLEIARANGGTVPALGAHLVENVRAGSRALARVLGDAPGLAVLAAVLLVPLTFYPFAQAGYSVPKATLLQTLAVVAAGAVVVKLLLGQRIDLHRSPLDLPIAAFLVILAVGSARANSTDAALFGPGTRSDGLITLMAAVALYFVAYNLPARAFPVRRALECLAVAATLMALEGIAETLGLRLFGLGSPDLDMRASSTSGHPDFLGGTLLFAWPAAAALLATSRGRARWLWAIALGSILAALFASYTRSAWVGSVPALVVMLVLARHALKRYWRWLAVTLAAVALFAVLLETGVASGRLAAPDRHQTASEEIAGDPSETGLRHSTAVERIQTVGDGSGRLLIWRAVLDVARDNPLLGVGYGNLYGAITEYLPGEFAIMHPTTWVDKAHNQYLDLVASVGLPGLAAYLWLIGAFGFACLRFLRQEAPDARRTLLVAILAGWAGYLVHLFFLFDTVDSLALFWVLMGLAGREMRTARPARTMKLSLPRAVGIPLAGFGVALAGLLVYWAAMPLVAEAHLYRANTSSSQHNYEGAIAENLKAVSTNPHSESIQTQAAVALAVAGEAESDPRDGMHLLDYSVRLLNQQIQKDPQWAFLYQLRGETYARYPESRHAVDAMADFRKATELYPHYYNAYAGEADMAHLFGQANVAIAAERKLLEVNQKNVPVLDALAQDYARVGRWTEAVATGEKLAEVAGDSAELRLNIARALLAAGKKDLAIEQVEKARALDPLNPQVDDARQSLQKDGR